MNDRPSRRTSDGNSLWFQTTVDVNRSLVAHAVAESQADEDYLLQALALEADWTLGRNPLNIIQMSTPSSVLASKRNMDQIYYQVGLEDGVPGTYPGLTPYVNLALWGGCGMVMSCPPRLYENGYPADAENEWPFAEAYFPSAWVYVHNEFTPQQTMRGKTALYGYLHALAGGAVNPDPALSVTLAGTGTVTSSPAGIDCGNTCSAAFSDGTSVAICCYAFVLAERLRAFPPRPDGPVQMTRSKSRPERHFADSFVTFRLAIAHALVHWLLRCPLCFAAQHRGRARSRGGTCVNSATCLHQDLGQ